MSFKETRIKNQRVLYAKQKENVDRLHLEVGKAVESGDFSLAKMYALDLAMALDALNKTANTLADLEP